MFDGRAARPVDDAASLRGRSHPQQRSRLRCLCWDQNCSRNRWIAWLSGGMGSWPVRTLNCVVVKNVDTGAVEYRHKDCVRDGEKTEDPEVCCDARSGDETHHRPDESQGFSLHLLHEEPDHSNAVFLLAWLPGRGTPAHDHKTWGVVIGLEGEEKETWWRRVDDGMRPGCAQLEHVSERRLTPGGISSFLSDDIHTVWNDTESVSWSLHVYGRHINHTARSKFDPIANTEEAYVLNVE